LFSKGQEEAPFQLLVAVVLMTFVIIVGMNAMQEAEKQKCFNDTEKAMNDFKLALEKTAIYKQPSNVRFNPPGCSNNEKFLVKKIDEPRLCKRACLNASAACVLLRYDTEKVTGIADKCINISYSTEFRMHPDNTECINLEEDGFEGTNIESAEGLEKGTFQFLYYSNPSISYPVVCTYVKN
jgi:hypothetical protein